MRRAGPLERACARGRDGLGPGPGRGRRPAGDAGRLGPGGRPSRCVVGLLAAHTAARAAAGWEPAEWALDRDLDDALDPAARRPHRPAGRRGPGRGAPPAGAAPLGPARHRGPRWPPGSGRRGRRRGRERRDLRGRPVAPRDPGDPAWTSTNSWPARGRLARDAWVAALVAAASPRARLLWADDLAGQRVVVASPADGSGLGRHAGAAVGRYARRRPGLLTPVELVRDRVARWTTSSRSRWRPAWPTRTVPVRCCCSPGHWWSRLVLAVGRVRAQRRGRPPLDRGGPARRRRHGVDPRADAPDLPSARRRLRRRPARGRASGAPPPPKPSAPLADPCSTPSARSSPPAPACPRRRRAARWRSRRPSPVTCSCRRSRASGPARGRVVVALTTLPNGALLRTVRVVGDGRGRVEPVDVETTRVVGSPPDVGAPFATRLPGFSSGVSRFRVCLPRAARAQLIGTASNTYPASEVTALRRRHRGARGRRRAASRPLPARRLGRARSSAGRLGGTVPAARPARPRPTG